MRGAEHFLTYSVIRFVRGPVRNQWEQVSVLLTRMNRRLLAFLTALCILAGATMLPAATATVTLVCRMTGLPMQPILHEDGKLQGKDAASAEMRMPCCVVRVQRGADGDPHFAQDDRSCCDMRVNTKRNALPECPSPAVPNIELAFACEPAVMIVAPRIEAVGLLPVCSNPSAPRAPPRMPASLRAPPTLS